MMRVTFVISSLSSGGAERVMSIMANYWAEKGQEITIITLDSLASDFYELHPNIKRIVLGLMRESENLWASIKNNVVRLLSLRRAIKTSKPEVVISFVEKTNILTLLATRGLGLKIIISERIDPAHYNIGRTLFWLRKVTYPWASATVVQTVKVREWMINTVGKGAVEIIPNPIQYRNKENNCETPILNITSSRKFLRIVVAMGRLSPQKGFDLLLSAFARVAHLNPEWCLTVFGEGEERDRLTRLSNELGVAERVFFPGRVKNPLSLLRQADIFVMSSRYEGFPNALLEAMSCGLAVISFDCPSGPREIIRNDIDGLLVPPEDVNGMSTAMNRLMANDVERERLASHAVEVTERFGLEKIMRMWESLLSKVLGGKEK